MCFSPNFRLLPHKPMPHFRIIGITHLPLHHIRCICDIIPIVMRINFGVATMLPKFSKRGRGGAVGLKLTGVVYGAVSEESEKLRIPVGRKSSAAGCSDGIFLFSAGRRTDVGCSTIRNGIRARKFSIRRICSCQIAVIVGGSLASRRSAS